MNGAKRRLRPWVLYLMQAIATGIVTALCVMTVQNLIIDLTPVRTTVIVDVASSPEFIGNPFILPEKVIPAFIEIPVCSSSASKTYMDESMIGRSSVQGKYIKANMKSKNGLLYDKNGFIGVALGSYFGAIGTRFIITLDTGIELKVVKVEAKSDAHTRNGCEQRWDHSVIEFVIDDDTSTFWVGENGYVANGNFNNLPQFNGKISKIARER